MTKSLSTLLAASLLLSVGPGCATEDSDVATPTEEAIETVMSEAEMIAALPTTDQLNMTVPTSYAKSVSEVDTQSEFAQHSYNLAKGANETVYNVLSMIDNITDHPSHAVDENTRAWGPHTEDGSDITKVFIMQLQEDGDMGYALRWKEAGSDDDAYVTVIQGLIYGGYSIYKNVGAFNIDYDAAGEVNPEVQTDGFAHYEYNTVTVERTIEAHLQGVFIIEGEPVDSHLRYKNFEDNGGELGFGVRQDRVEGEADVLEETVIHTRWHYDGAGRTDATITEGDLGENVVYITECWGDDYMTDYEGSWYNETLREEAGDEGLCSFNNAEYPNL